MATPPQAGRFLLSEYTQTTICQQNLDAFALKFPLISEARSLSKQVFQTLWVKHSSEGGDANGYTGFHLINLLDKSKANTKVVDRRIVKNRN